MFNGAKSGINDNIDDDVFSHRRRQLNRMNFENAEGLADDWSTGNVTRHPQLAATLGAEPDWTMVGTLFIGRPSGPSPSVRTPSDEVMAWLA